MSVIITDSGSSILTSSAPLDIDNLTDNEFSNLLEEFNNKADSLKDFFSSVNSLISHIFNDKAGSIIPESITPDEPVFSKDYLVQAFKQRRLERLDLGYLLPVLEGQEVNY